MRTENNRTTSIILILMALVFLVSITNMKGYQTPSDDSQTVNLYSKGEEKDWVSDLQGIPSIVLAKNYGQATEWQTEYQDYMNTVVRDYNNKSWLNNVFNLSNEKVKSPIVEIRQVDNNKWQVSTHIEKLHSELQK
ncbi:hypothetical protein P7H94_10460 [Lactococcus lactis]|uniref:hypothetical protein n=1 Tax=Lactococcus lactis TaxID=1358 RepID=UPI00288FDDF1|nr:hypothetical protein [Lactococcus lactis]MDT2884905.1 hypothetical protein [Lactococcus lactis]MDT2922361.1 hypothetical protein [Lactococcus lactis]MDT2941396.1 hypothetical protein [Lactococcus lactis]